MSGRAGLVQANGRDRGWRALGFFWVGIALCGGALAATLQWLGPMHPPLLPLLPAAVRPVVAIAAVAAPQSALLEQDPADSTHFLPRVSADGRAPRIAYAAHVPAAPVGMKRVGLIVAGFGLDGPASQSALRTLPAAVTLAVSPYQVPSDALLAAARKAGHEYWLSVPMEPDTGPLNDEGDHALLTSASPADNLARLDWVLSRAQGYAGATDLLVGSLRGRRFTSDRELAPPVLSVLERRGLAYAGAEPAGAPQPGLWTQPIDVLVDRDESGDAVAARLADLVALAQKNGAALGAVGVIRPVAVALIEAWAKTLTAKGVALVPVSALMEPPQAGK
jgi:polysaccharide deacetylase 2 family uncharacterized protein YibQ